MSSYPLLYFLNSGSAEIQAAKTALDFAMHSGLKKKISNTSKRSDKLVLNRKLFLERKLQISVKEEDGELELTNCSKNFRKQEGFVKVAWRNCMQSHKQAEFRTM